MKEDKYMNNLKMNINNFLYQMKNNGIIIYYQLNNILIKINNYHLDMIKINKYKNQVYGYNVNIIIIKNNLKP